MRTYVRLLWFTFDSFRQTIYVNSFIWRPKRLVILFKDCLLLFLSMSVFYFLVFLFLHFFVVGCERLIKLTRVGFRAHVKIASRIVSYRIVVVSPDVVWSFPKLFVITCVSWTNHCAWRMRWRSRARQVVWGRSTGSRWSTWSERSCCACEWCCQTTQSRHKSYAAAGRHGRNV